ncbi:hypothetical protein DPMN_011746 [Dreissena polymorpha]|uniref:MULE transposase domain-containing protein n=1 Tax=Dreissena polymorpha TaxID=45954 RepID=A0A9D4N6Q9_DREPO|nr:hypothetical protein DPMN_011746 [Dreissena polymorpha]
MIVYIRVFCLGISAKEYHQARKSQLELHFICRPCHRQEEPMPEPTAEPVQEEPMPEPTAEPVQEEPMPEPTAEPVQEEPMPEPTAEPVQEEPMPEPTAEPVQEEPMQVDAHFDISFDVNHRVADDPEEPQDTKTEADYVAVLTAIKEKLNNPVVDNFVLDFKQAAWLAVRRVFPGVTIKGCVFHWTQAVWRKVQDLGLVGS